MAKLQPATAEETSEHLKYVRDIFELLTNQDIKGQTGFSADKDAIVRVFNGTNGYDKADILVRLTLIDSMYSTQMSRRYYALDELAEVLAKLADGKKDKLEKYFLAFAKNPKKEPQTF